MIEISPKQVLVKKKKGMVILNKLDIIHYDKSKNHHEVLKETFHTKIGTIKEKNRKDLTEAEEIKKRWQEYTELYKKDLSDPDNHNCVVTHLQSDILEYEVKWALESLATNKTSGGDGISAKLFQILKDNAVEGLHSICQQLWKTQEWHRTRKVQLSF